MDTSAREAVREFLTTQLARKNEQRRVADGDDVIATGLVDSLGIVQLVAWIETAWGVRVRDDEILPENFASIDAITAYLERRLSR